MTSTQAAATALNSRLKTISTTFQSGLIMMAGGAALAAPLVYATKSAMDLQTALGRVQIATGASNSQMQELNATLTKTANATGIFSKPTLANFAADMYSSGITQMKQINDLLPLFAKGADLMKILSHGKISPEEAAHTFTAMAHQFGKYDAASMKPLVEAAVATAPALPGGLAALRGMGGYVNVLGNRVLGIDPVKLIALEATLNQTSGSSGAGGRGGLSGAMLIAALKRSMPGVFGAGLLSGKSAFSAEVMGLAQGGVSTVFDKKTGGMDLGKLIKTLSDFESLSGTQIAQKMLAHTSMLGKKAEEEQKFLHNFLQTPGAPKAQLLTSLLTNQAGTAATVLQLLGDDKFKTQLAATEARIKAFKGIEAMQAEAMKMLEPQLLRLQTNFTTLASTIGMKMIPVLTPLITWMGDMLDKLNTLAVQHPRIVQVAVSLIAVTAAALLFGGAIQVLRAGFMGLQLVAGAVKFGSILSTIGPIFAGLRLAILAAIGPEILLPIIAVVGAVALVMMNWGKIMDYVHKHSDVFIHIAAQVERWIKKLGLALQQLGNNISTVIGQIAPYIQAIGDKVNNSLFGGMAKFLGGNAAEKLSDAGFNSWLSAKQAENKMLRDLHPTDKQKALDQKTIGAAATAAIQGKPSIVVNQTNHITQQQVAGHDHEKCWKHGVKKLSKEVAHTSLAGSLNSVGQSGNSKGNHY